MVVSIYMQIRTQAVHEVLNVAKTRFRSNGRYKCKFCFLFSVMVVVLGFYVPPTATDLKSHPKQGRRRRYGRSGHGRTTFLAENGFGRTTFLADYYFFLPGHFFQLT